MAEEAVSGTTRVAYLVSLLKRPPPEVGNKARGRGLGRGAPDVDADGAGGDEEDVG